MRRKDRTAGLFCLAVSLFFIFEAYELGVDSLSNPGPGFVLFCAGLLLGILSIALVITSRAGDPQKKAAAPARAGGSWKNVLITIATLVVYALCLEWAGFMLATFVIMAVLYLVGRLKPWTAVAGALVTVALSYVIFHVALQVQFPRGPFSW